MLETGRQGEIRAFSQPMLCRWLAWVFLVAVAATASETPGALTRWLLGLFLGIAAWSLASGPSSWLKNLVVGLVAGASVASIAWALQAPPNLSPSSLDLGWVSLVFVPGVFLLLADSRASSRVLPRFVVSLAVLLGVFRVEPWRSPESLVLLGAAIGFLVLQGILRETDAIQRVSAAGTRPASKAVRGVLPRFALFVAAVIVLLSLAMEWGIRDLPAVIAESPAMGGDASSFSDDRWWDAGVGRAVPVGDEPLATVRVLSEPISERPKTYLYLREYVMDRVGSRDGSAALMRRQGAVALRRDGDDDQQDHRVILTSVVDPVPTRESGPPLTYEISLVTSDLRNLLLPLQPRSLEGDLFRLRPDGSVPRDSEDETIHYRVVSSPWLAAGRGLEAETARLDSPHRHLPKELADRSWLQNRADRWTAEETHDLGRAQRMERHLRHRSRVRPSSPFDGSYHSLLKGTCGGDSVHYAQALALLGRLVGIPTRVVVGFRTREWDSLGRNYLVRGFHRYAWTEMEFEEVGWVRFDPTLEPMTDPPSPAGDGGHSPAALEPKSRDDAGAAKTSPTLSSAPVPPAGEPFPWIPAVLLPVLGLGLVIFVVRSFLARVAIRRRRDRVPDRRQRHARKAWKYWQRFLDLCRQQGWNKPDSWTAAEFSAKLEPRLAAEAESLRFLVDTYRRCRFGGADLQASEERRIREFLARVRQVLPTQSASRASTRS